MKKHTNSTVTVATCENISIPPKQEEFKWNTEYLPPHRHGDTPTSRVYQEKDNLCLT